MRWIRLWWLVLAVWTAGLGDTVAKESVCVNNPAVVFCDDFESGSLKGWHDGEGEKAPRHAITSTIGAAFSGERALEVTYPPEDDGGWLTRWFMPGYDHVFARLYIKLQEAWRCGANCTKILAFYGNRIDDKWSGFGKAGVRPTGSDYFYAGLATLNWHRHPDPGEVIFYSYYPDMKPGGDGQYWGNFAFQDDPREALVAGRWHCIEFELQANAVGQRNGYQKMWIDGHLKGHVPDMRWRDTTDLRINAFQLTFSGAVPVTQRLWVDNVVVSTGKIGCSPTE